jgi:predicted nucleotidyltransferase
MASRTSSVTISSGSATTKPSLHPNATTSTKGGSCPSLDYVKPSELPELEKLAETLNRHEVNWVLIGGMAVMLYGADYLTGDCDLAYERTKENLLRLKAALEELGARPVRAPDDGPFELDFSILLAPFMHLKTEAGPVDLINRLPNIDSFEELKRNALVVDIDGVEVTIASIDDIIRLKTGSGRDRDQMHITMLQSLQDPKGVL